jgi:hypothetical protein
MSRRRRPGDAPSVRCVALRADGRRCSKWAMRDALKCHFHSRTKTEQLEMARSGGRAKAAKYRRETRCRCPECGYVHVRKRRATASTRLG